MSVTIKVLNKYNTKYSVNGKLCVLRFGPKKLIQNISYSHELTEQEEYVFKGHLKTLEII